MKIKIIFLLLFSLLFVSCKKETYERYVEHRSFVINDDLDNPLFRGFLEMRVEGRNTLVSFSIKNISGYRVDIDSVIVGRGWYVDINRMIREDEHLNFGLIGTHKDNFWGNVYIIIHDLDFYMAYYSS